MTSHNPNSTRAMRSSGNLLADRRYEYALGARDDGDHVAAADLLEQVLDLTPDWPAAWLALGIAQEKLGLTDKAAEAYAKAEMLDPADELGAALHHARLSGATPAAPPQAWVRSLFDQYAKRFDAHLTKALDYCGPELLHAALVEACKAQARAFHFEHILDLGCGTGLMGRALQGHFDAIDGVDLSPAMIEEAQRTDLYTHLQAIEISAYLGTLGDAGSDLVIAADVFVYLGDLQSVFAQTARVLEANGLFAFTLQHTEMQDVLLGDDLRYAHSIGYVEKLAAANGFKILELQKASTRKDAGRAVPGLIVILMRV